MRTTDWLAGADRRTLAVEKIHAAAAALFLEHGIDDVSVEDVAARAGCSRATLYRYVGGRDALLDHAIGHAADGVAREVAAAVDQLQGRDRVVAAILAAVSSVRSTPALAQWFSRHRTKSVDDFLSGTARLREIASALTGLSAQDETSEWVVRVVMSLLAWPLQDEAAEHRMIERFVAPAFG